MMYSLRRSYAEMLTSGTQLALLIVGFTIGTRTGWLTSTSLMALISLIAWYAVLKRYRTITGLATSKIISAAQGYTELEGKGKAYGYPPLISKLSAQTCLWYRYQIEEKNHKNDWRVVDKGETNDPFQLDDGSGVCIIDPTGAEIYTDAKRRWLVGEHRYTEWTLSPYDPIYALGYFRTEGGSSVDQTLNEEVKQVMMEWKADMPTLRKNFDLNNDGHFNEQEWMLARQAAKREAKKRLDAARADTDLHFLLKPQDGRLFLISNINQKNLARRYLLWSWVHILILFGSLTGLAWLVYSPI